MGTEQVAQGSLPPPPAAKGNLSMCRATGGCLHSWCHSLSLVAWTPAPPARSGRPPSLRWPILVSGTAPFQLACRKRTETHGTYQTDGCSDTNMCTWTCAHRGRHGDGTGSQPARQPQPPASPWQPAKSPCLAAWCYSGQQENGQWLMGPSGSQQPTWRRAMAGKTGPEQHGEGSTSSPAAMGSCRSCRQYRQPAGCRWGPAMPRRSQGSHLPTSLNQGKRS